MDGVGGALRRTAAFVRRHPVRSTLAATALLSLVLWLSPGLDLSVTRAFYVEGAGFPAAGVPFLRDLRGLGMAAFAWTMALAAAALAVPFLADGARFLLPPRAGLFLLAAGAIGPGLLVNGLLKGWWGRARPATVVEFGGDRAFSGPWVIADGCTSNCSFVSGEASSSLLLVGFAMIAPTGWKPAVLAGTLAFSAVMSLNRIAFGGHFLSDVLIAWCLTLAVLLAVHRAVYGPESRLTDAALADGLGAAGARLRARLAAGLAAVRRFLALFGRKA